MKKEIFFEEVFDAQKQFRIVLDAMAHPGIIYTLNDFDLETPLYFSKASAVIAFTLLNADASFHAMGDFGINQYIALNTAANEKTFEKADFVFMNGQDNPDALSDFKIGSLSYPEDSATVIIDVEKVSDSNFEKSIEIIFRGPGVEIQNKVFIGGIRTEILDKVKEINFEFPLGIDLIFCDKDNQIVGLPRSNKFDFKI
jgi:alpha-D-ribose 1-methylphosphonate 5-triphosphate synthase subunit PhnH